jgi:hypothetical protein
MLLNEKMSFYVKDTFSLNTVKWLQDPNEINGDNLNNIRRETSRHFRKKKREYLKGKFNEFAKNSKKKNISSASLLNL